MAGKSCHNKKQQCVFYNCHFKLTPSGTKAEALPRLRIISRIMVELIAENSGNERIKTVSISSAIALFICAIPRSNSKSAEVLNPLKMYAAFNFLHKSMVNPL